MSLYDLLCCCCKPFKDSQELNINGSDSQKTKMPQLPYLENERKIFVSNAYIREMIENQNWPRYMNQHRGDMGGDPSDGCEEPSAKSLGDEGQKSQSLKS